MVPLPGWWGMAPGALHLLQGGYLNPEGFIAPAFPAQGERCWVAGERAAAARVPAGRLLPCCHRLSMGRRTRCLPEVPGSLGKRSSLLSPLPGSLLPRLDGDAGAGSLRLRHPLRVRHLQPEDPGRLAGTDRGEQLSPSPGTAEAPSPSSPSDQATTGVYRRFPFAWRLLEPELVL